MMKKNRNSINKIWVVSLVAGLMAMGCKKLLEPTPPPTVIIGDQAFATDSTAIAVMNSVYSFISQRNSFGQGSNSIGQLTGFAADESTAINYEPYWSFYKNAFTAVSFSANNFWSAMYGRIYTCNKCIEVLPTSKNISGVVKKQLTAEAKFMRAFVYFQLVNLFGDVPLAVTTDYRINNTLFRTPVAGVYAQITADLKDAQADLPTNYVNGFGTDVPERVRPNRWAATAMLARVYLYLQDWTNAEAEATKLISNSNFTIEPDPNSVFLATSREAVLQLQPGVNQNTTDATWYILPPDPAFYTGNNIPMTLRAGFTSLFEAGDTRRTKWIGQLTVPANGTSPAVTYSYVFKYKKTTGPTTEYLMVLRLAEQYLIRAEARAVLNNLDGAKDDVDNIRSRAGLASIAITTKEGMLAAIAHERQVEFFAEWGHRWFDLKRTGTIDTVMANAAIQKGSVWNSYAKLFPIPQTERQANSNLTQNPGY